MPWEEWNRMSRRLEFVVRALLPGANIRGLCREYGISPKTGYKWIGRYLEYGEAGLGERGRSGLGWRSI
jgi:transposase-like protein